MNRIPDLTMIRNAARAMNNVDGVDIHTITAVANGQHGDWDVTIVGTDLWGREITRTFVLSSTGSEIKEAS